MKIAAIDSFVLRVPTQKPIALEFPEQKLIVAHIRTDDGVTGLGYSLAMGGGGAESIQVLLVSPHVVHELSLQVVGALANGFLVEWIDWAPADLFEGMPRCEDGQFRISDRPGHGLALTPDAVRKYRAA